MNPLRQLWWQRRPLRAAIAWIEQQTGEAVAGRYPQGRRLVLDGAPADGAAPAVAGFGDLRLSQFIVPTARVRVGKVRDASAARTAKRRGHTDPAWGSGAAEQYVRALRAIGRALEEYGIVARNPMAALKPPNRPGPGRSKAFSAQELIEYARTVLTRSSDPELDAVIWCVCRVIGGRLNDLLSLRIGSTFPRERYVTVYGKSQRHDDLPVHQVLLELAVRLHRQRCPGCRAGLTRACVGILFVSQNGFPVTKHRFENWSRWMHHELDWAADHPLRVHGMRHSGAREGREAGFTVYDVAQWARHAPESGPGTTGIYLHDRFTDDVPTRVKVVERTFGLLDGLPDRMPEWEELAPYLIPSMAMLPEEEKLSIAHPGPGNLPSPPGIRPWKGAKVPPRTPTTSPVRQRCQLMRR